MVRRPHGGMRHMAPLGQWGNFNVNNNHLQEMVRAVQDIFPHVPANVIAEDLAMTHSVEATTENILEGRVVIPPQPATPPPSRAQPQPQPQQVPVPSQSPQPVAPTPPVAQPTAPVTPQAASSSSSSSTPSSDNAVLSKYSDKFAADASTRKASLQARKQAMLDAARKYVILWCEVWTSHPKEAFSATR